MSDNIPENAEDDLKARNKLCKEIANHIRERAKHTDISINFDNLDIQAILPALIGHLDNHFGIQPKESSQANELIKLTQDIQEALSNERVSYDEISRPFQTACCRHLCRYGTRAYRHCRQCL